MPRINTLTPREPTSAVDEAMPRVLRYICHQLSLAEKYMSGMKKFRRHVETWERADATMDSREWRLSRSLVE